MNFNQVFGANGANLDMFATLIQLGERKSNQNGNWSTKCLLVDDQNQQQWVKIWDDKKIGNFIDAAQLNQRLTFSIGTWQNPNDGKVYLSGFWRSGTQTRQNAPQAPQNATQSTNSAQPAPQQAKQQNVRDLEQEAEEKRRSIAYHYATSKEHHALDGIDAYTKAEEIAYYMKTGNYSPDYDGPTEPPQGEGKPAPF